MTQLAVICGAVSLSMLVVATGAGIHTWLKFCFEILGLGEAIGLERAELP